MVSCKNKCFDRDSNMDNNRYKIIVLAISQLGRRLLALLLFETKCHSNSASITVIFYV